MTIDERIEKLELKLNRAQFTNRLLVVLGIAVFLGMIFCAPSKRIVYDEVRAKSFVLEDENGNVRAKLLTDKDKATLNLIDENEILRFTVGVGKDGALLGLADENSNTRAMLGVADDGAILFLADENEILRFGVQVAKEGASLGLYDENEKIIWSVP
ncbi:hypothetical protein ACFL1R_12020 [Candidatus Latescibacterota bacterium]